MSANFAVTAIATSVLISKLSETSSQLFLIKSRYSVAETINGMKNNAMFDSSNWLTSKREVGTSPNTAQAIAQTSKPITGAGNGMNELKK